VKTVPGSPYIGDGRVDPPRITRATVDDETGLGGLLGPETPPTALQNGEWTELLPSDIEYDGDQPGLAKYYVRHGRAMRLSAKGNCSGCGWEPGVAVGGGA